MEDKISFYVTKCLLEKVQIKIFGLFSRINNVPEHCFKIILHDWERITYYPNFAMKEKIFEMSKSKLDLDDIR